jgi:hypothetical protein
MKTVSRFFYARVAERSYRVSIKGQLNTAPEGGVKITGQDITALERFAEDTRHI